MRVDIGIDTESDGRLDTHAPCNAIDGIHLGDGLDIETTDADLERSTDLLVGLAYAGKHDGSGGEAAFRSVYGFVGADAVSTEAALGKHAQQALL